MLRHGLGDKLVLLADHVKCVSKRMFDMPDFFYASGDRRLRDRSMRVAPRQPFCRSGIVQARFHFRKSQFPTLRRRRGFGIINNVNPSAVQMCFDEFRQAVRPDS